MIRIVPLLAIVLGGCADLVLIFPHDPAITRLTCLEKPPIGVCSPSAGAIKLTHTWRF